MNIILVHGAWHSAQCWTNLISRLDKSHRIFTPDMPGREAHDARAYRKLSLHDYVQAIRDLLCKLDGPSLLIGHSLAGMTISQVAQMHPDLVSELVYIAGFIPASGESMFDITSKLNNPGISTELIFKPKENKIEINKSHRTQTVFYGDCAQPLAKQAVQQLIPEPLKAFSTQVSLSSEHFGRVKKSYIRCLRDLAITPFDQNKMIDKVSIDKVYDLEADHSPFLSAKEALANVINSIADLHQPFSSSLTG